MADNAELNRIIESILFVAEGPVELRTLGKLTEHPPGEVAAALTSLADDLKERGVRVQRTGNSVMMVSAPETTPYVQRYLGIDEHARLSPVVLATLTVIAYKQPVTKGQVERILRKNCDYGVMVLKARDLITETGRAKTPGLPYLYGTTFKFLEHFGLEKPEDLPPLPELETPEVEESTNGNGPSDELDSFEAGAEAGAGDEDFAEAEAPGA
ncbi:MAG: SMC-Scp complex subunit ScpB [Chloroflexota bacterium]